MIKINKLRFWMRRMMKMEVPEDGLQCYVEWDNQFPWALKSSKELPYLLPIAPLPARISCVVLVSNPPFCFSTHFDKIQISTLLELTNSCNNQHLSFSFTLYPQEVKLQRKRNKNPHNLLMKEEGRWEDEDERKKKDTFV